jgi:hypothetical protein
MVLHGLVVMWGFFFVAVALPGRRFCLDGLLEIASVIFLPEFVGGDVSPRMSGESFDGLHSANDINPLRAGFKTCVSRSGCRPSG